MGEQKEGGQNNGDKKKKAAEGGGGPATTVLKMDLHCDGCAKKVKRAVKRFDGVEDVKVDTGANKITVAGKVDPAKLREHLEEKTQKKVELVSHSSPSPPSQPKKDGGGGGAEKKAEGKKAEESKKKLVENEKPKESTVVLKINLHCAGCVKRIKKRVAKVKGVESVTVDDSKDLVIVKGTMEANGLAPYLRDKLKRSVEVVPPKKEEAAADKKEKPASGDGGGEKDGGGKGKKKEEGKEESNVVNIDVKKMEHGGYPAQPITSYWNNAPTYAAGPSHTMQPYQIHHVDPYYQEGLFSSGAHAMPYSNNGYVMDPRVNAPQIFSDENPHACSIM
ncbi:hypothetical protein BT93_K0368 [Corymbia citriodora subsp. variegata]|nr:hypothetical protein BT93_K0368 [Corymbia citriodora subsp. variegata]